MKERVLGRVHAAEALRLPLGAEALARPRAAYHRPFERHAERRHRRHAAVAVVVEGGDPVAPIPAA